MTFFRKILDCLRKPVLGMTLEQQDVVRNALWAARGILLHSRNGGELSDQDFVLVCKRFDQIHEVLRRKEKAKWDKEVG